MSQTAKSFNQTLSQSAVVTFLSKIKKASDYLAGVRSMYRAGYQNTEELAELSILAQAAGDMDAGLA